MVNSLNIIFAGTPPFAAFILNQLIHSTHTIKAVYTQPDRPKGRGLKLTACPVKLLALEHQLPVFQPASLRDETVLEELKKAAADIMIVVAYGLILPSAILTIPRFGCLNLHASLLPQWRGAAPIQRSILANDQKTGVSVMQMDTGLDTGPVLSQAECEIEATDTAQTLSDKLAQLGSQALIKTLDNWGQSTAVPQDNALATYAHKISKEEAELNWQQSALELSLKIRAFNPWPIAFTQHGSHSVRIWEASIVDTPTQKKPGFILQLSKEGIDVATGQGILRIKQMQFPGEKVLPVRDILNAKRQDFEANPFFGIPNPL